jgi:TPR repeat protein
MAMALAASIILLVTGPSARAQTDDRPLWEQAADLLQRCRAGEAVSCRRLAAIYEKGTDLVLKDPARAEQLYQRACRLGDAAACARLHVEGQHVVPAVTSDLSR